jgi:hypothetical protein
MNMNLMVVLQIQGYVIVGLYKFMNHLKFAVIQHLKYDYL